MKRILPTLALMLVSVPVMAQQPLVSGSTTGEVTFVMYDDAGAVVASPTITGVIRRRGTGDDTAMTTPTTAVEGNGFCSLVVDEDTTITSGLVREGMFFAITASDAETAYVSAVIEAPQATVANIVEELLTADPLDYDVTGNVADLLIRIIKTGISYTYTNDDTDAEEPVTITPTP